MGGRCKHRKVFSQAVLMAEDLLAWCGELEILPREPGSRRPWVSPLFRSMCEIKSLGGWSDGGTPGHIPNPAVKPVSADGTRGATLWESRSSPRAFFICVAR